MQCLRAPLTFVLAAFLAFAGVAEGRSREEALGEERLPNFVIIFLPTSRVGEPQGKEHLHTVLHPEETTLAEVLREAGYATACLGKWHLGEAPELLPTRQGFDLFFGTPKFNGHTRYVHQSKFVCQLIQ